MKNLTVEIKYRESSRGVVVKSYFKNIIKLSFTSNKLSLMDTSNKKVLSIDLGNVLDLRVNSDQQVSSFVMETEDLYH